MPAISGHWHWRPACCSLGEQRSRLRRFARQNSPASRRSPIRSPTPTLSTFRAAPCALFFATRLKRNTWHKSRPRRRRPKSSMPARNTSRGELSEADVFCGHAKVPVDWDAAVRRGRLRWIQSSAAGLDHCLLPSVVESEIIVTSASGILGDQVSEQALALLLGVLRQLAGLFSRSAEARIHSPANARSDRCQGADCRFWRRRAADRRSAAAVSAADFGHRRVCGRSARLCRAAAAGRPARRAAAGGRDSDPVGSADRHHAGNDRPAGGSPCCRAGRC